jgi:transcriptional regulator with XRE-family HTH domain
MRGDGTSFGERLRQTRRDAGLSQSDLEVRCGIPKARLSRYENGHVLPSIGTLRKLAAALAVSEASLLGDQRAIIEEFFHALLARGITIRSPQQARLLAEAVAGIHSALAPIVGLPQRERASEVELSMVDLTEGSGEPVGGPG